MAPRWPANAGRNRLDGPGIVVATAGRWRAMDQSAAPLLEALADYHARDRYGFTPPGHRQGRGADPRTVAAIGRDAFRSDVLATAGLDDRTSSHG